MTPSVEATFKICCASTLSASCPSNYSPALDLQMRKIHCSSTNSNVCPQMSECLQSATQSTVYICCKSNESPRICPNNQNALITNGMLETCSGPQNSCSQINYSCQYSTIVSSWVCCGRGSAGVPTCRNGDQPYSTIAVEIFRCSLITQNCIFGYVCEPSTVPTVNVCCPSGFVSTVTPPSPCSSTLIPPVLNCPSNWTPYKYSNGNYHLCNSVADRDSCPVGFSCTPANIQSLFLCCRLSIVFECPPGTSSLIVNNQPRLCSQTSIRSCPPQYQCLQSTYVS
uniref:EB domain-containing protein n=1 Tax=Rhabditophanes sp. KR3021 TaxID=114890 RepID=A0AC35U8Q4_9BILA